MKLTKLKRKLRSGLSRVMGVYEYNILSRIKPLSPKEMIINITYWCNSRCTMCNIWKIKPKHELSHEQWIEAMQDPVFSRLEELTISGGEPTQHRDFNRLAELFVNSMPRLRQLTVITNGFLPTVIVPKIEKLAQLCMASGVHLSVSVSLDGVGKIHEDIRRIPDGFKKTTTTINELQKIAKRYGIYVGSGSVVMRQNIFEVEKLKQWYKAQGMNYNFQIVGFHDVFLNNLDTKKEVDFKKNEKEALLAFLKSLARPKSLFNFSAYYWADLIRMYRDGRPRTTPCPFLKDQFVIDSFGDVYYCLSSKAVGNWIKEKRSIGEIYYDRQNQAIRAAMPLRQCRGCNSGCNVEHAISKDLKKYLWFLLSGRVWGRM